MKITYYGHATFLIEMGGKRILFDPFISANDKVDIDINSIKTDYILVSHGHGDHVADVEAIAKNNKATVIAPYEVATHFSNKGLKTMPMNHGGKREYDFGTLKLVNAVHSSSFPDGSYGGNPVGFVLWNADTCLYFAGDTALTFDMKLIPMTCPKLDFAILPIGDHFTMGYEEAIIASDFIDCDKIIGCHYDTFGYIEIDHKQVKKAFSKKEKDLILPEIGKTFEI